MRAISLAFTLSCLAATVSVGAPQTTATQPARSASRPAGKAAAPMTNEDVLKMVKAGLGDPVVMAAVRGAKKTAFELSADGLIELKTAGVSDSVIAVMLDPAAPVVVAAAVAAPAPPPPPPPPDPNDPLSPHDAGVYIDVGSGTPKLVAMEPTSFKQGKSGGFFTSAMTMGIKKMKWKAVVPSSRAVQRTRSGSPSFYFYFEKKSSIDAGATNPSEFVLARMSPKSDKRELIVGEAGAFGASSGTREKDSIEFRTEKLGPGVFKVSPSETLGPGEYCFFIASGSSNPSQAGATGHLFDFGVDG
jgi:hypothetical protein